jgi:hypothetical protein
MGSRDLLNGWGHESEIVAERVHPDLLGRVHRMDRAGRQMLQGSAPHPPLRPLEPHCGDRARVKSARIALCYHNITPGQLLREFNPEVAALCDRGRDEVTVFRGRIDALMADPSFNALDLRQAGLGDATIVPLLLDVPSEAPRRCRIAIRLC